MRTAAGRWRKTCEPSSGSISPPPTRPAQAETADQGGCKAAPTLPTSTFGEFLEADVLETIK